jgi:ATP-dependent helicase HrpA
MNAHQVIKQLQKELESIMVVDAAWCRRRIGIVRRRLKKRHAVDRMLQELLLRFSDSQATVKRRSDSLPEPEYDAGLPISAHREELISALREHQVLIVAGETGSGKTTQLPKLCLEACRGTRGLIACTQPRRIAARAMADRVSEELGSRLGDLVAYQVRFRERSSKNSLVKFMTDGILLAETAHDRDLNAYDTIIIDEAHERSLNIDFLLGYLKVILRRRPDLKLIITSATIDTAKFSSHFNDAPVVTVSGRGYPVDIVYQPLSEEADDGSAAGRQRSDRDLYKGISDAVRRLGRIDPRGDILVFLSGEREIREAGDFLARQRLAQTEILPLYARLSAAEQRRVFHPGAQRRIILSTNVAETSLTVPRIRFVVDSGLVRISRYAHRSRIQRLPIEPVSQASANQRSGRCGRLGPGTCVRLYDEADFLSRPEFTEPEILRTSLASVILRMLSMGLGTVEQFPFIDAPAPRMINDAYKLLFELGAIDDSRKPTPLGLRLARWPMDVRLARMVVEGSDRGCLEDLLVLAAALSIQDPRERPLDAQAAADEAHGRFSDERSDFSGFLLLWQYLRKQRKSVSGNQFRKLCRREFLNWQRVLEWFDLYQQLRDQAREDRLRLSGRHGDYEQVHKALLSGLLSHVGLKHPEDHSYQGVRAKSFHIFPGSGLFGRRPKWLMCAEIVETSRPWGRGNAVIQPEWIEELGKHLLKHRYFDPHWSRRRGEVLAWEQVSLFGLVIVEKRRVRYAPIDSRECRRIFILHALVRGELDTRASFMDHNRELRSEVEALEHKRRKRDVLADEHAQFDFFAARIPDTVDSARSFEKWLSRIGQEGRRQLHLGHDILMREDAGKAPGELFPDRLVQGGNHFRLDYQFEPGHEADGVSLTVPLELLNTLDAGRLQWLVPGLLRDKLIALIRQLPKPVRRSLTPVPDFADALGEAIHGREAEPLLKLLASEIRRMTGMEVAQSDLEESSIADHFRYRIQVTGDDGSIVASGRDLAALQAEFGKQAQRSFMDRQGEAFNRDGEKIWVFGRLPVGVDSAGGVKAFPALVDQHDAVGLRLFDTRHEAWSAHQDGVLRLLGLSLSEKIPYLRRHHGLTRESQLVWSTIGSVEELASDLAWSSLALMAGDVSVVRDQAAFEALCERARSGIGPVFTQRAGLMNQLLPLYGRIDRRLSSDIENRFPDLSEDIWMQLSDLVYPGFLLDLEADRLGHYPRYLQAIEERLLQAVQDPGRDRQRMARVTPWWRKYIERLESGCVYDEATDAFRWLLEEYRVSLFAQKLGTACKVSEKRLEEAWRRVQ